MVQIRDITERKEREQELKRTRELVEKTQENASIGWWEVDLVEDRPYWSDEVYRIHDLPVDEEVKLEDGIDFYHPEARPTIREAIEDLTTKGEPYDLELRIVTAADRVRWIRTVGDPQYNDDGEIVGILGLFQDITERKEREETLRQFQEAVERTAHAVYITDTDGKMEYVNPAFEEITGFRAEEAIGQTPRLLKSGEHDTEYYEKFWKTIEADDQWKDEVINMRADGEKLVLDQTIAPIVDDDDIPQKYVAVAQDITLRKQYEEKTKQARTELRQVLDLIPDPLYAKNQDDKVLFSNVANAELHGMVRDEIEGKREYDIESDVENIQNFDKYRQREIKVMETGESMTREEELTDPNGHQHIFQVIRMPFEARGTDENAVLGYARDVTALKQYEQQLETQRDNLDLLNQVVRHDIRNDLQLIQAYAGMLAKANSLSEEHQRFISKVLKAANNAVDLTTTARDLSEVMLQDETETKPIALAQTVQQQVERLRYETQSTIITISDSLPAVDVAADELLEAIFRNLLKNAVQHNDKDIPEITVSAAVDDRQVVVTVADNGRGVADAQKKEIFGRGNQGLESEGTGIGLYLVQTLVDRYGGDVWVEDNDPEGAIFCVELQIAE